jgi:hypothetical protein
MDRFNGAHICAGTAVGAELRVDLVNVTFGDSLYRTFINTCAASCTVVINYICHSILFLRFEIIDRKNNKENEITSVSFDFYFSPFIRPSGKRV